MSTSPDRADRTWLNDCAAEAETTARAPLASLPERQLAWDRLWQILLTPRPSESSVASDETSDPTVDQAAA